jgi:hypothetical protein
MVMLKILAVPQLEHFERLTNRFSFYQPGCSAGDLPIWISYRYLSTFPSYVESRVFDATLQQKSRLNPYLCDSNHKGDPFGAEIHYLFSERPGTLMDSFGKMCPIWENRIECF